MPLLDLIVARGCRILRWEPWDAPAGRWFFGYRARAGYHWLLGHAVVDEFATVSAPLFFSHPDHLGRIYSVGISLGHRRDPEMGVDQGWPPFCAGIMLPRGEPELDPESAIMSALVMPPRFGPPAAGQGIALQSKQLSDRTLECWRLGDGISCFATDVPLLPRQLRRLCEVGDSPLTLALSLGNRLARIRGGLTGQVQSASEATLDGLLALAGAMQDRA